MRQKPVADVLLLTWASGVLDALSYLRAKVFTANMTGNTVVLGLAIAGPDRSRVPDATLAIGAFAAGVLLSAIVLLRLRRTDPENELKAGTSLEIPFAVGFAILWDAFPGDGPAWAVPAMLGAAACALGIQSVAARRLRLKGVATTFITGTITTAIVSAIERYDPSAHTSSEAKSSPLMLGGMFVLYIVAAMTGGALALAERPVAPYLALAALVTVWIRSFRR